MAVWFQLHTNGQLRLTNMDNVRWIEPTAEGHCLVSNSSADGDFFIADESYEDVRRHLLLSALRKIT